MSAVDHEYLVKNNVPKLFNDMILALVQAKPAEVVEYVHDWTGKQAKVWFELHLVLANAMTTAGCCICLSPHVHDLCV